MSAILVALCAIVLVICLRRLRGSSLPPGPTGLPILGNMFLLASKELWLPATELAAKYGDIVHLHAFGQSIIFLASPEAAVDLLEKRGSMYSGKPPTVMAAELVGAKNMVVFSPYGPRLKAQRKFAIMALGAPTIPSYHPPIEKGTRKFLAHILAEPENYEKCIRLYAGSLTLSAMYGYDVKGKDDEILKLAEECMDFLSNKVMSGSGIWPVDIFPFLRYMPLWMPGSGFLTKAAKWKATLEDAVELPYQHALNLAASGGTTTSFCSTVLHSPGRVADEEFQHDLKWTANSMYMGSIDTILASLTHLLLMLIRHPEAFKKAREEIDRVVGTERLPTFADRPQLPHVDAVMNEVWRYNTPLPIGLPHAVTEHDIYRGYHIPKGSLVFGNIWAMSRNKSIFDHPETFDPQRYMNVTDPVQKRAMDPRRWIFGFGRRHCPGMLLADAAVWNLTAAVLATLEIQGDMKEKISYDTMIFRQPNTFKCGVKARSEGALRMIGDFVATESEKGSL